MLVVVLVPVLVLLLVEELDKALPLAMAIVADVDDVALLLLPLLDALPLALPLISVLLPGGVELVEPPLLPPPLVASFNCFEPLLAGWAKTLVCFSNERSLHRADIKGKSKCLLFSLSKAMSNSLGGVWEWPVPVPPELVVVILPPFDWPAASAVRLACCLAAATEACSWAIILLSWHRPKSKSCLGLSPAHWAPLDVFVIWLLMPRGTLRVMGLRGGNWLLRNAEIESCDCCSPAMLLLLLLVVWLKGVGFDGTGRKKESGRK